MDVGEKIASGRDCYIYAAGPGKVVRRARDGRNLEREASVMQYARRHGFPVPEVFDADDTDILMERIDGVDMAKDASRRPWRLREHAASLAGLLRQLGAIKAPDWVKAADGCVGFSLLHMDLHPLNVLITPDGPCVIDWSNARRGAANADVANSWLIMATVPVSGIMARVGRRLMLGAFLDCIDRDAARPYLEPVAERRLGDNLTLDSERVTINRLLLREIGREVTPAADDQSAGDAGDERASDAGDERASDAGDQGAGEGGTKAAGDAGDERASGNGDRWASGNAA